MKNSVKTHISVDGVILTPECTDRLKQLQEHDNEGVQSIREHIADAVCYIAEHLDDIRTDEEMTKVKYLLTDLSFTRDYFLDFKKP